MLRYRLRHRITIEMLILEQDALTGEVTKSWAAVSLDDGTQLINVPAEVLTGAGKDGAGKESVQSGSNQEHLSARINMRWFPADMIEMYRWRIQWNGILYNIKSVETDLTGRREWRLRCDAGLTDGEK